MKNFVIAHLSFFDNDLIMEQVSGTDRASALREYLFGLDPGWGETENFATMSYEDLVDYALDSDLAVGVFEV